jgi:hypothetical protein
MMNFRIMKRKLMGPDYHRVFFIIFTDLSVSDQKEIRLFFIYSQYPDLYVSDQKEIPTRVTAVLVIECPLKRITQNSKAQVPRAKTVTFLTFI